LFYNVHEVKVLKKIGILYHPMIEATLVKARELETFLAAGGVSAWVGSAWDNEQAREKLNGTDLLIAVGGDGTILRAAQIVIPGEIPIIGINMGKLGFMTEIDSASALEELPSVLSSKGWIDERNMLQVAFSTSGKKPQIFHALNDVVVARGEIARATRIEVTIDREYMTTYQADAVIMASATGSTGYALAAGGPILYPQSGDFVLVPVAPHPGCKSALVLPVTTKVTLRVNAFHPATLSVDGHMNFPLSGADTVTVMQSPHKIRFLRLRPKSYFYSYLEEKLRGK
jgi:NAD+ kinase